MNITKSTLTRHNKVNFVGDKDIGATIPGSVSSQLSDVFHRFGLRNETWVNQIIAETSELGKHWIVMRES